MIGKTSFTVILLLSLTSAIKLKNTQNLQIFDYIIVGAGISGLKSAEILLEHNKKILILEGQDRIGGKALSIYLKDIPTLGKAKWFQQKFANISDLAINLGASQLQDFETEVLKICQEQKFELRDIVIEGKDALLYKGERYDPEQLVKNDPSLKQQFFRIAHQLEKDQKIFTEILDKKTYIFPKERDIFLKYDSTSAQQYFDNLNITSQLLKEMFLNKIEVILSVEVQKVGIAFVLYDREAVFHELLQHFGLKPRQLMKEVIGGSHRITNSMADKIERKGHLLKDIVKFNYRVTKIDNNQDIIKVYAKKEDQKDSQMVFLGKKVINAMGIIANQKVEITKISKSKRNYLDSSLVSTTTKCFIMTPKPFNLEGLTGTIMMGQQNQYVSLMRDYSPDNKAFGNYLFYIVGAHVPKWQKLSEDDKKEHLWNIIIKGYGLNQSSSEVLQNKAQHVFLQYSVGYNKFFGSAAGIGEPVGTYKDLLRLGKDCEFKENQFNIAYVCSELSDQIDAYMEGGIRNANQKVNQMLEDEESDD